MYGNTNKNKYTRSELTWIELILTKSYLIKQRFNYNCSGWDHTHAFDNFILLSTCEVYLANKLNDKA